MILNFFVAAGGTGGHLFPALAVVEQLEKLTYEKANFIFTGNPAKIEARVVPALGYQFNPINVHGLNKMTDLRNLLLPLEIYSSYRKSRKIIKDNKIDALIAAGAYLSYPPALAASMLKKPVFLIESNVVPGKSIKMLQNYASLIFLSYKESKKFFKHENQNKLIVYGNPIRNSFLSNPVREISFKKFGLDPSKSTILIFGGSLGSRSINQAVSAGMQSFTDNNLQILWQTGAQFELTADLTPNIKILPFIDDMPAAYSIADLVVSRSGGTTVAEISAIGKPSILIPFPSASNNEQESNAQTLVDKGAALLIKDNELEKKLAGTILNLIHDRERLFKMAANAKAEGKPNAAINIAQEILKYIMK